MAKFFCRLIVRSTVIMTRNKFITKWNLAHVFMIVLEVISQKSFVENFFFYHAFKLWTILAPQNHDERYIVCFQISQLFKIKMFFIIYTSKRKANVKDSLRRLIAYFEDQIFRILLTKMAFFSFFTEQNCIK